MSSYFDFFCKDAEKNDTQKFEKGYIKGTCYSMCPQDEIQLRVKENLVHVLEVVGHERKLVKCYSRSAADSNIAVPRHLRPYHVLRQTVHYLLFQVTSRTDVPTSVLYDFINDRLRAIRQDMIIQSLPPKECITLLEPMVRFHVFYGYKLYGLPPKDFESVLNKKYLLECLKWCLSCYNKLDEPDDGKEDELSNCLFDMKINEEKDNLICDRVLMESIYILCNLDDFHPLFRYINLSKDLKCDHTLRLAYKIAIANLHGNYVLMCKLLDRLCPLTYCALCVYLPILQRKALQVLSHAYNSKRLTIPGGVLRQWLRFAADGDVRAACRHYGLAVDGDCVRFDKGLFKTDVELHKLDIHVLLNEKMNLSTNNVFTYTTNN